MDLKVLFEKAVAESTLMSEKPGNEDLLKLSALYKQSTEGDIQAEAPSNPFDFVAKMKFAAWEGLKGWPKEKAMKEYIDLVEELRGN